MPLSEPDGGEEREQVEIDRTQRLGTGLAWGGIGTSTAGSLILLGLIPTSRNLRLANAQLEMRRVSMEFDPGRRENPVFTTEGYSPMVSAL